MSVKATPAAASEAWSTGFGGAATKYAAGINAVQIAPGQLAANQKAAYVAGVNASQNIWAAKVAAVDINSWKAAATGVGVTRLASGATKGAPKVAAFMQTFLPKLSSVVQGLPARGSFDQNMTRFQQYATQLHQAKGTF